MTVENQHLKHGKALCGKVFARFVETFNALVDFMCNVHGDADANSGQGHITFDRSNPLHPVIRCDGCRLNGGGGDSGDDPPDDPENPDEEDSVVTSLNDLTGDVTIIGGKGIRIEKDGNVIKIVWDEDKEDDDELPSDPCAHPEGEPVPADDGESHGGISGGGGGGGGGGVPADGDSHAGDGCTSEECDLNK